MNVHQPFPCCHMRHRGCALASQLCGRLTNAGAEEGEEEEEEEEAPRGKSDAPTRWRKALISRPQESPARGHR